MPERSDCPDCGNEVAVNRDGTLRKHACESQAPATVVAEPGDPAAVVEPDAPAATEPAPSGRTRREGACCVDGCWRPEVVDGAGLCGAHWALRPDLRKGARRG